MKTKRQTTERMIASAKKFYGGKNGDERVFDRRGVAAISTLLFVLWYSIFEFFRIAITEGEISGSHLTLIFLGWMFYSLEAKDWTFETRPAVFFLFWRKDISQDGVLKRLLWYVLDSLVDTAVFVTCLMILGVATGGQLGMLVEEVNAWYQYVFGFLIVTIVLMPISLFFHLLVREIDMHFHKKTMARIASEEQAERAELEAEVRSDFAAE